MANIELLAEITASGMYIFDYFTKVFFGSNYSAVGARRIVKPQIRLELH